jgi:hypothetical protein
MHKNTRRALLALIINLAVAGTAQLLTSGAHAAAGDLFATDSVANNIRVYALDGSQRIFATGLNSPQGLTFDGFGNLYVADKGSGSIYKFTADGTRSVFASGLNDPIGITIDGQAVAVAENGNAQLKLFDRDGNIISSTSAGSPYGLDFKFPNLYLTDTQSLIKFDGANNSTTTSVPGSTGVAVDASLDAFVSDTTGTITEITDAGVTSVFASGLTTPGGMAFRGKRYNNNEAGVGDLFVAETDAGLVSEYTVDGTRTVFATGGHPNFLAFELILPGKLLNISTRLNAQTGDNVLIGGFIITGTAPKNVLIRALGPSLTDVNPPIPGALQDPILELHRPDGTVITNDNWKGTQQAEIEATGIPPTDDRESAMVRTLDPGAYTAIVRGKNGSTGVAMVEVYDLDPTVDSELANISTRGTVQDGDSVMIGGFIIDPAQYSRVLIRAIGPSLANATPAVPNPLADPFLELHDVDGNMVASNDNWQQTAKGEIAATGIAPTNVHESAILANLQGGNYTAIVHGANNGTGVALVEIYHVP